MCEREQIEGQTDRQTDRQTERQTDRQAYRNMKIEGPKVMTISAYIYIL